MTAKTTSGGRNRPVWQFWRGPGCGASGLPSAIEGVSPARVLETSSEALGGITKPVDCCQEAGVLPSNRGRRGPVGSVVGDRPKPCGSTWSCSWDPAPNRGVPLSVSCETFVRACLFGRTASPYDVLQKRRGVIPVRALSPPRNAPPDRAGTAKPAFLQHIVWRSLLNRD